MRLTAYKKLIDECKKLPEEVKNDYFKDFHYQPRLRAVNNVLKIARLDVDGLFDSEYIELYNYTNNIKGGEYGRR